jgi:putative transposase
MTNHVHLVMTPGSPDAIGRVMQSVGRRYVRHFNRASGRTGALWEGRYRATVIDSDSYLLACYRYVELNPVRAGMVTLPGDYRWSSYRTNAFGHGDELVTAHERYMALGLDPAARQSAYRELLSGGMDDTTLDEIRSATKKGWALGTIATERRGQPLPAGRRPRNITETLSGSDPN